MRKLFFLFTALCLVSPVIFGQNITFRATTEKVVVVGQQFRVNYTLTTGGETGKDIRFPDTNDFDNIFGPTVSFQSSSSYINGKSSTQATGIFTYVLLAKSEGTFTIPPATIKVGNSEYKSNELTVKVLPPDQAANAASANANAGNSANSVQQGTQSSSSGNVSSDDVFVRMIVSKNSVYENEGFLVTFKLYTLVNIAGFDDSPKFPEYEGFIAQEIDMPPNAQWALENYNGRNYQTLLLKQTVLFPQHSGKITIASGKFNVIARIRTQRRQRSFFDDFFDTTEDVKRTLTSSPVTIDVKPLPPGKPDSFTGAVGDYKMTSSISTNQLKSNDAVTVKVTISGSGNIKLVKNPEIVFPNDFDAMDPVVTNNTKVSSSGVTGTKTIEYNAIPRFAGDFTIPKAEFSYFDLKSGAYKTLTTDEYALHVEQGEAGSGINAPIVNATNKEEIRFLGKDIRYIKTDSGHFHKGDFFFGTFRYLLFYIVPALLFLILFLIYRNQAIQNANIALVRTKKANKVASKRLKTAAKYLKENKTESFYDETLRAVWGYLSDKLNIPVSALTKDNVDANLTKYGATESLIKDFRDILDTAEFARFAPAQESGKMDELYDATVQAIDKMENTIKK
ncbi:MAG: BatD family protein [Candidatus Azobacteroides sp.]|nr:BatD family protein [Candidatus Azobacteroides sp.]